MSQITAKDITRILHGHFYRASQIIIPRFTPLHWWECDLWRLSKTGMVDEYEIKLSVADFKADAGKERTDWEIGELGHFVKSGPKNKHALLAGSESGPNRFWFVMPATIADKVNVPWFAGLIAVESWSGITVRRRAPKRHSQKWAGDISKLLMTFYHRYWHHEAVKVETSEPIAEI